MTSSTATLAVSGVGLASPLVTSWLSSTANTRWATRTPSRSNTMIERWPMPVVWWVSISTTSPTPTVGSIDPLVTTTGDQPAIAHPSATQALSSTVTDTKTHTPIRSTGSTIRLTSRAGRTSARTMDRVAHGRASSTSQNPVSSPCARSSSASCNTTRIETASPGAGASAIGTPVA